MTELNESQIEWTPSESNANECPTMPAASLISPSARLATSPTAVTRRADVYNSSTEAGCSLVMEDYAKGETLGDALQDAACIVGRQASEDK
jgi:hypothetical protein